MGVEEGGRWGGGLCKQLWAEPTEAADHMDERADIAYGIMRSTRVTSPPRPVRITRQT